MSYISASGSLIITADNVTRAILAESLREEGWMSTEGEFLREGLNVAPSLQAKRRKRGVVCLEQVQPEDIGALTDAPILAEVLEVDEDGKPVEIARVWWFPQYELRNPWEDLARTGRVEFTEATT